MKNVKKLSNAELSSFCFQLSMMLSAGITPSEALELMQEDTMTSDGKKILCQLQNSLYEGLSLYQALDTSGLFPEYVIEMIHLGEETGNLDIITQKLADYYEQQCSIVEALKSALSYPLIMLGLMLCIIIVLLTTVLPIFNEVFLQLGSELTGIAWQLLSLGRVLQSFSSVAIFFILLLIIAVIITLLFPAMRRKMQLFFQTHFFTKNFMLQIAYSRFASSLALINASGVNIFKGLELVEKLVGNELMSVKIQHCKKALAEDEFIYDALKDSGIFRSAELRMLEIGYKTGKSDDVLLKISANYQNETLSKIRKILNSIEPTLVIVFSLLVGLILLSVILPLIGVMSNIG